MVRLQDGGICFHDDLQITPRRNRAWELLFCFALKILLFTREVELQREYFLLLIGCKSRAGLPQPEAHTGLLMSGRGPGTWAISCCLPGVLTARWNRDLNSRSYAMLASQVAA